MEFESLIAEFGARYGIDGLALTEDGAVGLAVNGQPMSLRLVPETSTVVATIEVGEMPDAGVSSVDRLIAKANRSLYLTDGMVLVFHSKAEHYCLLFRIDIAQLDFHGFDEKIARFLAVADQWREFLEKFIPLAAEAATIDNSDVDSSEDDFSADLIRV